MTRTAKGPETDHPCDAVVDLDDATAAAYIAADAAGPIDPPATGPALALSMPPAEAGADQAGADVEDPAEAGPPAAARTRKKKGAATDANPSDRADG